MESFIRIGTRGSALALWQANHIAACLNKEGIKTQIVIIETTGDKILDVSLSKIGSKGVFTEELEKALYTNEIDIAAHSAKDVQSTLPADLPLIAITERETVNDVLVSNKNVSLQDPITVGTSSTRRVATLRHFYPHINIVDMRGNLQTRFKKLDEGHCDAMILAFAGVHRMNLDASIKAHLSIDEFIPPVGQGAVAIQGAPHLTQQSIDAIRRACNHAQTENEVMAERAFLKQLDGGCSIPLFAHATTEADTLFITGGIVSLDGSKRVVYTCQSPIHEPEKAGKDLAELLIQGEGIEILNSIRTSKA